VNAFLWQFNQHKIKSLNLGFSQNLIRVSIYIRQNEQIITEAKSLFVVMPIE